MIIYWGNEEFDDIAVPAAGKSDWGMDTLSRRVRGARNLLVAYIASLAQGQDAPSDSRFKLQSWSPDDSNPLWGEVTLNYKGLIGAIPPPITIPRVVESSGSSSHYFDPPYEYSPEADPALSAVLDYSYYAGETTFRYITNGQPTGPSYNYLVTALTVSVKRQRITLDDGTIFGGTAPAGIASAVSPALFINTVGFTATPVHGTPYWEAEDTVRAELIGA